MRTLSLSMLPLVLLACGDKDDDTGGHDHADHYGGYSTVQHSAGGSFELSYTTDPATVGLSEEFSLVLTVADIDGNVLTDAGAVEVEATMPAHGHGMNVTPVTTDNGDGTWTAAPMKFHMEGDWQIDVTVTQGGVTETAYFTFDCCG